MIALRDAVVLEDTLVMLSAAYAIRLMPAPNFARWLLIEFIAVSKVAMEVAAAEADEMDAVLIPKLAVPIEVTTTEMVCPLDAPLWNEKVEVAFIRFMPFHVVWLEMLPIWVTRAWNSTFR